jgi:hypothetical protein
MKIKKIDIHGYGPIKDLIIEPADLECIFGLNETGKTALIEVLIYVLFKKTIAALRYDKPKDIAIMIAEKDISYTLPAKKTPLPLPPVDIAPLLYVQASKSAVYDESNNEKFWDRLKTMFTSLDQGITFARLDAKIFEAVKIQPKKLDWEKDKYQYIEQKKKRAQDLGKCIKEIGTIEKQQDEIQRLKNKQEHVSQQIEEIENYKKFMVYKELSSLYEEYTADKNDIKDYERYKDDYLVKWQELDARLKTSKDDECQLDEVKKDIVELEKDMMELRRKEDFITAEGLKELCTAEREKIKNPPIVYPLLLLAASLILAVLSLFTRIPQLPAFIVFLICAGIFLFCLHRKRRARKTAEEKHRWLQKAKRIYPDITDLKELTEQIAATDKLKIEKTTLLNEKKKIENRLSKSRSTQDIEKELSALRSKTGLAEIGDLKKKIEEKKEIENRLNKTSGKIYGVLSEKNDAKWERAIEKMRVRTPDKEPDLARESDLNDDLRRTNETLNKLQQHIEVFNKTLQTSFQITDHRDAFVEYDKINKELKTYELEKKAARTARDILKSMSRELDAYIEDIIKGDSSVTEYFKMVTDRYTEVLIKDKNFAVMDANGQVFDVGALSSGTQDQLLLCFRIAALKKLYPDGCFLLLDDAFIFADWHRRTKLVQLIRKFIDHGNQVIYLTSDDHTRDLLHTSGARITTI